MANEEHLRILKQGVEAWNAWREQDLHVRPFARGKHIIPLKRSGTQLLGPDLSGADLSGAHLSGANLSGGDLIGANVSKANLSGASLSGGILIGANLMGANLSGVDFSYCIMGSTVFADVDLSHSRGLDTARHELPSTIGVDTIYRSAGNIPDVFLRGAGVPERFIEYLHSLVGQAVQFYSCFISYSHHDQSFCERLHADLQARAVRVWYFPEDALVGRKIWGQIDRSIRIYDKLVVVCSEHALQSPQVLREIERALQREDEEGTDVLFPIRIDDYISKWQHERKPDVIAKVVGDFSGWENDAAKYEAPFRRLMKALQPEEDTKQPTGTVAGD